MKKKFYEKGGKKSPCSSGYKRKAGTKKYSKGSCVKKKK